MANDALLIMLQAAVPLHIAEMQRYSEYSRASLAYGANLCRQQLTTGPCPCDSLADVIAVHGDVLQYGGKGCAQAFNALARSLALLSFAPGGVTFAGYHWCQSGHMGYPQPDGSTSAGCEAELARVSALTPPRPEPPRIVTRPATGGVL